MLRLILILILNLYLVFFIDQSIKIRLGYFEKLLKPIFWSWKIAATFSFTQNHNTVHNNQSSNLENTKEH